MSSIAVLGAGGFGTALAVVSRLAGHDVTLMVRRPEVLENLAASRQNATYLPGVQLPDGLRLALFSEPPQGADVVVMAVPSIGLRDALSASWLLEARLVVATKGLEHGSGLRPSEVATAVGLRPPAVMSGPMHAEELARGLPTAAVVAGTDAAYVQNVLSCGNLRLYVQDDVTGVELGGATKNVMALAAGMVDGLKLGDNAKAALVARGLFEMVQLATALGARPDTLSGLSGLGDLNATCYGRLSRNRWAGEELGRGRALEDILRGTPMVVEGVPTTRELLRIADRVGIELPLVTAVAQVLFAGRPAEEAWRDLFYRRLRSEFQDA